MTVSSMTGFARAEGAEGVYAWAWEIKSVNGRGLDARMRLAAPFEGLEPEVRTAAQARLARGNLQISLQVRRETAAARLSVNEQALSLVIDAAERVADRTSCDKPRPEGLLALRGVLEAEETNDDEASLAKAKAAVMASLGEALDGLAHARAEEGAKLHAALKGQVDEIEGLSAKARAAASAQPGALRARLKRQVAELLAAEAALPEDRLAQEVALLLVKADIREELDRLDAHVAAARELMAADGPVGRKLDFLAQEFNREANTLCSKAQDPELKRVGLDLKAVIDQLREQVQNIE
ncbi:MAG: YicC/YloC family endoribonuclease [Pseudomonadota bacterium]